ncbi:DUF885 domain-containing protein [Adhaeribacter aquaticus]|uniref:DUF885 domain-containing protein n=1 Tax=Adhaeribacter aquaticus TaxID=299567 RepID=UPI00040599D7|nr:DUF885 domain-containing protein [Adhaeribacter aquaticus]
MMKKYLLLVLWPLVFSSGIFLVACDSKQSVTGGTDTISEEDVAFDAFKENLLHKFWRLNPEWASSQGFHNYDTALVVPTANYRKNLERSYKGFLKELEAHALHKLSPNNRTDYYMIQNHLNKTIWEITEFEEYKWNPARYNIGSGVAEVLNSRHDNLTNRLRVIGEKLARSIIYYETAIDNLEKPTLEHTQLAILQNKGALTVFGPALQDSVAKSDLAPHEKEILKQRIEITRLAIENYLRHLEYKVLPAVSAGKSRSFRIGSSLYARKFNFDLESGFTANEIYQKAVLRKRKLHQEMLRLTEELWPKYFPGVPMPKGLPAVKSLISRISQNHVPKDSFLIAIQNHIPELVKFVNAKNLLTQDPTKPLKVRITPPYMQGIAGASVSAPGPYDKEAITYYNVMPITQYSPKAAESYLREYNRYMMQILNIHEAIPGHYTQLIYSNRSPSVIKAVLGNGAMIEGWAVYAEQMMLEEGYGNNSPELWLMWYKWNLRVTLNAILDYGVHVQNIKEAEAIKMLRDEGFQEEAEAQEKLRRATLSQVQLASYFTGFTEIHDLRQDLKKQQGKAFSLKNFHEQFLSYGSAPVRHIRELMLDD